MTCEWFSVAELQADDVLLVEDGNHGESRPRRGEFGSIGTAFVRAADMSNGSVAFEGCEHINDVARERIRKGVGAPRDILLSHKGTVGKLAQVASDAPPFVCSPQTTFWRITNTRRLHRSYLYAFMQSHLFTDQLRAVQGETDMAPYVSLTAQRRLKIALPALHQQIGIGDLLGAFDDKIELNRRMAETLEAMARALFKSWFVDFDPVHARAEGRPTGLSNSLTALFPDSFGDNELPTGWSYGSIADFAWINPPTSIAASVAPYVDMAALPIAGPQISRVVQRAVGSGARFRNGDTLVARITPCLENGKTALVDCLGADCVGWGSTEFIVLRPRAYTPVALPYLIARHQPFRDVLISGMSGSSGRQRVPPDAVVRWRIAVPTESVLTAFGNQTAPLFQRITLLAGQTVTLSEIRDTLLPKLISGELRIADAEQRVAAA